MGLNAFLRQQSRPSLVVSNTPAFKEAMDKNTLEQFNKQAVFIERLMQCTGVKQLLNTEDVITLYVRFAILIGDTEFFRRLFLEGSPFKMYENGNTTQNANGEVEYFHVEFIKNFKNSYLQTRSNDDECEHLSQVEFLNLLGYYQSKWMQLERMNTHEQIYPGNLHLFPVLTSPSVQFEENMFKFLVDLQLIDEYIPKTA